MSHLLIVPAAVGVFASTNVDDLVVLTMLFLASRSAGTPRPWQVVAGQAAGIAVLVASASVAAVGLLVVPSGWVGLLGLVPLTLGVWRLVRALRMPPEEEPPTLAVGLTGVAGVAIINGADNITIYTPVFRSLQIVDVVIMLTVFVGMIGLWCAVAAWLGSRLSTVAVIRRHSDRLVPMVFIAIGAIILVQSTLF